MANHTGRRGFTFFRSYYEPAAILPDEQRLAVYDAILGYSFEGHAPAHGGKGGAASEAVFLLIKPHLDSSLKKSEAGAKGGRRGRKPDGGMQEPCAGHYESKTEADLRLDAASRGARPKRAPGTCEGGAAKNAHHTPRDDGGTCLEKTWFDEFWEAYPRKVGKASAKKVWDRLKPNAELKTKILDAVEKQKSSVQWSSDNGQFIPHPTTWLNGERWGDDLPRFGRCRSMANFTQRSYDDDFFEQFYSNEFAISDNNSV